MLFMKTLNVWARAQKAIMSGQIKVQVGQWFVCGEEEEQQINLK